VFLLKIVGIQPSFITKNLPGTNLLIRRSIPIRVLQKKRYFISQVSIFSLQSFLQVIKIHQLYPTLADKANLEPATWRREMTGKSKDIATKVNVALSACVFLIFALLFFSGCAEQQATSGDVETLKITPAEKTEDELLAEFHFKFENPDAHYQLGGIYHKQGRWAKAEYHYNLALSFDPSHRAAQAAMVKMLTDSGDATKAEQFAKAYMNQVAISAKQSLKLARAFEQEQLYEYALTCYEQSLRLGPNLPEVSKYFGYYYMNQGDKARAKEYLTRSFQLNPNQPDVAGALGRLGVAVEVPRKPIKQEKKSGGPT